MVDGNADESDEVVVEKEGGRWYVSERTGARLSARLNERGWGGVAQGNTDGSEEVDFQARWLMCER